MKSKFKTVEKIGGKKSGFMSQIFRTSCDCEAPEHVLTLRLYLEEYLPKKELEPELILWMTQNIEVIFDHYTLSDNWFKIAWARVVRYYQRFKGCIKLFFTGYLEAEGCFICQGEDHIQDIIDALKEGREELIKEKDKWMIANLKKQDNMRE